MNSNELNIIRVQKKVGCLLLCVFWVCGCGTAYRTAEKTVIEFSNSGLWHVGRHGALTEIEQKWARISWQYFENNYNHQTGFVNSTDRYPVVSIWHVADYIAALYCAKKLKLIENKNFDERFSRLLLTLNTMELAFGVLPNTLYNTTNASMVNYANQPEEIGWSIIDIGRLLFWLYVIKTESPEFSEYIDRVVLRFSYCDAIDKEGAIFSAQKYRDEPVLFAENGVGYREYAQIGLRLWGLDVPSKYIFDPDNTVSIFDVDLSYDANFARQKGTFGGVFTAPYVLGGIETNWEMPSSLGVKHENGDYFKEYAYKVYLVQQKRYEHLGITTARTDHQLGRPPFYIKDSILADGYPWSTLSNSGENLPQLALVSVRAAFGMWILWDTAYTDHLIDVIDDVYDSNRGWYEGRYENNAEYERTITISTNATVLEALTYKKFGKLFGVPKKNQYVIQRLGDRFFHPNTCLPKLGGTQ